MSCNIFLDYFSCYLKKYMDIKLHGFSHKIKLSVWICTFRSVPAWALGAPTSPQVRRCLGAKLGAPRRYVPGAKLGVRLRIFAFAQVQVDFFFLLSMLGGSKCSCIQLGAPTSHAGTPLK